MKNNKVKILIMLVLLAVVHVKGFSQQSVAKKEKSRPNIIFLLTDDQRWDAMGAMGNSIIQTPNMDKLANAGVLFQNAYVTTSIFCVSRVSILTGQYESKHHNNDFNTDLLEESIANSYPALLKNAGYNTGFIGKF